jgi:diphthine synthase
MLYIIGLGLNEKGISLEGLEAIKKCSKLYLENYTVNFPYSSEELEKVINSQLRLHDTSLTSAKSLGKKIINATREVVESNELIKEAKKGDIALLVYGSPLTATTHITLIEEAKKEKVKYEIIYNASVLDAIAETGLQLYKFGKIASIPNFEANSFAEIVKDNQKINAHSLILVDIGMNFEDAIRRIEKVAGKSKIVVCSMLGTRKKKIFYGEIDKLKNKKIEAPFCMVIPSKLHFVEEEVLESFS